MKSSKVKSSTKSKTVSRKTSIKTNIKTNTTSKTGSKTGSSSASGTGLLTTPIKKTHKNRHNKAIKPHKLKPIREYCKIYKKDIIGKPTPQLFNACKINKYCRKTKCGNIDKTFEKQVIKRLGQNYNVLLQSAINTKCPIEKDYKYNYNYNYKSLNRVRSRCIKSATRKFYNDNELGDQYAKLRECDEKTCAKERQIFYTNLFRNNKRRRVKKIQQIQIEELPDEQMIQIN